MIRFPSCRLCLLGFGPHLYRCSSHAIVRFSPAIDRRSFFRFARAGRPVIRPLGTARVSSPIQLLVTSFGRRPVFRHPLFYQHFALGRPVFRPLTTRVGTARVSSPSGFAIVISCFGAARVSPHLSLDVHLARLSYARWAARVSPYIPAFSTCWNGPCFVPQYSLLLLFALGGPCFAPFSHHRCLFRSYHQVCAGRPVFRPLLRLSSIDMYFGRPVFRPYSSTLWTARVSSDNSASHG